MTYGQHIAEVITSTLDQATARIADLETLNAYYKERWLEAVDALTTIEARSGWSSCMECQHLSSIARRALLQYSKDTTSANQV